MTNLTKLFFASLFTLHACAHVWEAPAQTVHAYDEADPWEWTPAPTAAPGPLELVKRQNPFRSVCGYVNGNQSNSLTCNNAYCGFNSNLGAAGCCTSTIQKNGNYSLTGCQFQTTCQDLSVSCDSSCKSNPYIGFCTKSQYPYCLEYLYAGGSFSLFACTSSSASPALTLEVVTTYGAMGGAGGSSGSLTSFASEPSSIPGSFSKSSAFGSSSVSDSASRPGFAPLVPFTQTQQTAGGVTAVQTAATSTSSHSGGARTASAGLGRLGGSLVGLAFLLAVV